MKFFATAIILAIGAAADDRQFISGELYTKETFKYGKFEVGMEGPFASGTMASFYTIQYDAQGDPDFDISNPNAIHMEVCPSWDPVVRTKVKTSEYEGMWEPLQDPYPVPDQQQHKYEFEWTPEYVLFKIDDKEVRYQPFASIDNDQAEQHLVMQYRLPLDDEPGADDLGPENTHYLKLDYISTYDYNEETKQFELRWHDAFDTLDSKWGLGWHTFGPTKFSPDNVYVNNGKLVMKMEKAPHDPDGSDSDDSDSDDDSGDDPDFHVLPPPQDGTLDSAIEKTTRVLVTMLRTQLENFSASMSHHFMQ